jgi:type IX secretion system PorP/SprF family membrane protein
MRKWIVISLFFACAASQGLAQQRAQMTHYLFQQLAYNPAYAGARGHLQSGMSFRSQWMGMEGGPRTAFLNAHGPLRNNRLALGFQSQADWTGPTQYVNFQVVYAYRIALEKVRFSGGIQVGMENFRADWTELDLETPIDDAFPMLASSWWSPLIGVGVLAQGDRWYAGLSCPFLLEQNLFYESETAMFTQRLRHLYAMGGAQWQLAADWRFYGATLLSYAWGSSDLAGDQIQSSPVSWDLYASAFYRDLLLGGISWQTGLPFWEKGSGLGQTAGLFAVFQLDNGLRFGFSYDLPLSRLARPTAGSLEWTMGYEWKVKAKKVAGPRFFW